MDQWASDAKLARGEQASCRQAPLKEVPFRPILAGL